LIFIDTNDSGVTGGSDGCLGACINGSGMVFLDGATYKPVAVSSSVPSWNDVRWDTVAVGANGHLMIYIDGNANLGRWDPMTGQNTVLKTFGGYGSSLKFGPWKGNVSLDGSRVVLTTADQGATTGSFFAYDMASATKYADIPVSRCGPHGGWGAASISPKGDYVEYHCDGDDSYHVTDLDGNVVYDAQPGQLSHADMTIGQNGDEVLIGKDVSGDANDGRILKMRLRDGAITVLTTGGYGRHSSSRGWPGNGTALPWGLSSMEPTTSYPPYNAEMVLENADGSKVFRLGQHHSLYTGYNTEVIPSLSPDGMRAIFASNFQCGSSCTAANNGYPVQVYVADYRSLCGAAP
jgi:hypothetical protein